MITFVPLSVPYAAATATAAAGASASGCETSVRTKLESDAPEQEHPRALAYLLQMDDVRVLIDCGSPEDFLFSGPSHLGSPAQPSCSPNDQQPESSSMAQQRQADSISFELDQLRAAPLDTLLRQLASTIDLVLLSHSSLDHLGLYAYAHAHFGLRCQVYATMPVQSMGKLTVIEAIQTWTSEVDIDHEAGVSASARRRCLATVDQVEDAFDEIKTVRYMQPTHLEGKCASLTLTAYNAGHSLGGAIWKIRSPTSGTVVIALDWNHNRERHLDGTILLSSSAAGPPGAPGSASGSDAVRRPDLLITEIERGLVVNTRRKDRDAALIELVHTTIQAGNSVLFPVDASARLLELMVLLDQHWAYAYPHARFPLCLVSRTGKEVMERSRTYMEWMTREWATKANETIEADKDKQLASKLQTRPGGARGIRGGPAAASSPLDFKYVRVFASLQAMDEAIPADQPKVVLAVPPSMTHGPSRRLLSRFAANPNDAIVLISRGEPGSLCRQLWDSWAAHQAKGFTWSSGKLGETVVPNTMLQFELKSKVPLEGDELRAHLEAEQAERDRLAQQRALLARSRRRLEADEDEDSDSDSDSDDGAGAGEAEAVYDVASGGAEPGGLVRKRPYGVAFASAGATDADGHGADTNQLSFDIYLKGNASRATSFFGSKAGQEGPFGLGVRYRLFPAIERKRMVDGFGEVTDIARWLSRRRALEAAESAAADPLSQPTDASSEARRKQSTLAEPASTPSKYITQSITLTLGCKVCYIDLSGLNDGRALKTLIPQLHPRRLVMVNGDAPTRTDMLAALSAIKGMSREVYAPTWMESVQIGEVTNSYTVSLGDGLLAGLEMSRFEEFEVAHVRATVKRPAGDEAGVPVLETISGATAVGVADDVENEAGAIGAGIEDTEGEAGVETAQQRLLSHLSAQGVLRTPTGSTPRRSVSLSSLASTAASTGSGNRGNMEGTLFIGDLKLSTLKATLAGGSYRLPADFAGEGMLVCAPAGATMGPEAVTVQKQTKGRIVIQGNVGKSFRNVRKAVYSLHANVAAPSISTIHEKP